MYFFCSAIKLKYTQNYMIISKMIDNEKIINKYMIKNIRNINNN